MGYNKSGRAVSRVAEFLERLEGLSGEDARVEFSTKNSPRLAYLLREGLNAAEHLQHPRWGRLKGEIVLRIKPGLVIAERKKEDVLVVEASVYAPANTSEELVPQQEEPQKIPYLTFSNKTDIFGIITAISENKGKNYIFEIPDGVNERLKQTVEKFCLANNLSLAIEDTRIKISQPN